MYISVRKTEGAIKNGRHWQYWAQKKQAKDTQNKQKTPQHKIKKMSNTDPTKKTGVNPGASEV